VILLASLQAFISRVSYFPVFDNCSSTLRDFCPREDDPIVYNAYAKRPDRLAETSEWGAEFPMDCAPNYMSMGHSFHYGSGHC